ncbi:MAG TPA: amidohydrolase family protein [Nocardioides sp.]
MPDQDSRCGICPASGQFAGTGANQTPFLPVPPGSSLHETLGLLQDAGMTPTDTLLAATANAAEALELTDHGTLTAGKRADLVLLHDDPVADPTAARAPARVWIGGSGIE